MYVIWNKMSQYIIQFHALLFLSLFKSCRQILYDETLRELKVNQERADTFLEIIYYAHDKQNRRIET